MRFYIKTFGCTANKADSLRIMQYLFEKGHTCTYKLKDAEMVVVNTCIVTETTQRKVLKYLNSIPRDKRLIVAGCLPSAQPEALKGIECHLLPNVLEKSHAIIEGVTGVVGISRGCVGECSYCIVKKARGELKSRPVSEIVNEVKSLLMHGAKEIQLTSQDLSAYGMDTGQRLPCLLEAITSLEGDFMIRLGMMNPSTLLDIVDEMVELFRNPHIFKFLHLPVQSGSDKVLEHMNRGYKVEDFRYIVKKFREAIPGITLSTDFIVGYPTETEQDFQDTLKLLNEIQPQKVNITRYSPRPGTKAYALPEIPSWKKKERSRILTREHLLIDNLLFQRMVGEHVRILTTEEGRGDSTIGRDIYYNNIVVNQKLPLGRWYNVKITESRTTYLMGERVD